MLTCHGLEHLGGHKKQDDARDDGVIPSCGLVLGRTKTGDEEIEDNQAA